MSSSSHVEPVVPLEIARHYIRELIYGANDGIITTFAVVAGVAGGGLSLQPVLIVGAGNLLADGLSMGVGNYLAIRPHESVLEVEARPQEAAFRGDTAWQRSWRSWPLDASRCCRIWFQPSRSIGLPHLCS